MRMTVASAVLIAAFTAACHKHAENAQANGTGQQAQTSATADAGGSGAAAGDAGGTVASNGTETAPTGGDARANEEACVDAWLQSKALDQYGNKEGTMYMGGTPLFNERTGERTDRLEFVYNKHPEAKQKCAGQ